MKHNICRHRILASVCIAAFASVSLLACSDDDDSSPDPQTQTESESENESRSDTDPDDSTDVGNSSPLTVPDGTSLDTVAYALEAAMGDVEVEIDGTTLHVRIPDDNSGVPSGTGCMIVSAVLPEGASAVVYQDGQTTPCD